MQTFIHFSVCLFGALMVDFLGMILCFCIKTDPYIVLKGGGGGGGVNGKNTRKADSILLLKSSLIMYKSIEITDK